MRSNGMKLGIWLRAMRLPFLQASMIPSLAGISLAIYASGGIDPALGLLAMAGAAALHISANMLNDYFDFMSGNDLAVRHGNPFAGGSRILPSGMLDTRSHFSVSLSFLAIGLAIGAYFIAIRGLPMLLLSALAGISAYFYVGPPLRLAHRGLGEPLVGLNFGLITVGTFIAVTGMIDLGAIMASSMLGILTSAILWINEFPDIEPDSSVGKRTLVVRMGYERAIRAYSYMLIASYGILFLSIAVNALPLPCLISALSLPMAFRSLRVLRERFDDPDALIPGNVAMLRLHMIFGIGLILGPLLASLAQA